MPFFKSVVSLDLGAKCTGAFFLNHAENQKPSSHNARAVTFVMPAEGEGLKYSTKQRTAARHRIRSQKRFKFARRLLWLIVSSRVSDAKITLSPDDSKRLKEALSGLLKRRGYSRVASETDITPLEQIPAEVFAEFPATTQFFDDRKPLADQWEELSQDLSRVDKIANALLTTDIKAFKRFVGEQFPELEAQDCVNGFNVLRDSANEILNQKKMGHRSRIEYLELLRKEIDKDTRLTPAIKAFGGNERFHALVGNISNLQLRAERWYFNAPFMLKGDVWDSELLQKTLVRAFRYFHPEHDQREQFKDLIAELEQSTDVIESLCTISPIRTIPPYEDQNNRRPPVDQTLLLNPVALTKQYGERWHQWASSFLADEPALGERLNVIVSYVDRKSRVRANPNRLPDEVYKDAYVLQRVLDRNRLRDKFALRRISTGENSNRLQSCRENLSRAIGTQHLEEFLSFAATYYVEISKAKSGLWVLDSDSLLERADIHPKHKANILGVLIGNVFGLDQAFGDSFTAKHWNEKLGRSSLKSICRSIEKFRKDLGNDFNARYCEALAKKSHGENLTKDEKELCGIQIKINHAVDILRHNGDIAEECIARVANPYSLAQLYTLIEEERFGFTSTSLAVHLENAWRMTNAGEPDKGAQCSRLPADSVRPFDGVLKKVLERQAWEIAKVQVEELKKHSISDSVIDMITLVEQNKFEFSASLATLKKNKKAIDKAQGRNVEQIQRWLTKSDRIKFASQGVCPYTGKPLGESGEIDHIVPRSSSLKAFGTIFNSEANLIYVSQEGNQQKSDSIYGLDNLADAYLQKLYGTTDRDAIKERIERTIRTLLATGRMNAFSLLTEEEKRDVRHALFLTDSEIRRDVIITLGAQNKSRVNGTQSWLIRKLIESERKLLEAWCTENRNTLVFHAAKVDASLVHEMREALGRINPHMAKPEIQPVASHSIDALCSYAVSCGDERLPTVTETTRSFSDTESPQDVKDLFPDGCDIVQIKAKDLSEKTAFNSVAIFKEGILGEDFLPVQVVGGEIFIGFNIPKKSEPEKPFNGVKVLGNNPSALLTALAPCLDHPPQTDLSKRNTYHVDKTKAFELFSKAFHSGINPTEQVTLQSLEALHFLTVRKEISSKLIANNRFQTRDDVLKPKDFQITVGLKLGKDAKATGTLRLPSFEQWCAICDDEKIASCLGKKTSECAGFDLNDRLEELIPHGSKRPHACTRRVWSLPIVATPSGVIRLKRETLENQSIYQAANVNSAKYIGFAKTTQGIDWKTPVLHPAFLTANLTPLGEQRQVPQAVVSMRNWVQLQELMKDFTVWMAPGSEGRRYIRVEMPFDIFKSWIAWDPDSIALDSCLQLPESGKASDQFGAGASTDLLAILGKPRSKNLKMERIGNRVRFSYIVDSSNDAMRVVYAKALSSS